MNTKRIKITDPKDLREGMRVEVEYDTGVYQGVVCKSSYRPSCRKLTLDSGIEGARKLVSEKNKFETFIKSIHRLIDGIEDVVVEDDLKDEHGYVGTVVERLPRSVQLDNDVRCFWMTLNHLKERKIKIHIPKEEQKTELTETEATLKTDSTEESEFGDDTNVATKEVKSQHLIDMINAVHREDPKSKDYIYAIAMSVQGALVHAGIWEQVKDMVALQPGEVKCNILRLRSNVDPRDPWDIVIKKDDV